jgi:hypothetical protein
MYEFVDAYRAVIVKAVDGIGYDLKLRYLHENTKFYIDVSLGEYVARDRRK